MRKPYHAYNETYRENFYFLPGYTEEELLEAVRINADLPDATISSLKGVDGRALEVTNERTGWTGYFIWLKSADLSPRTLANLAHEVFHIMNYVLAPKGLKLLADDDEPAAYFIGWLYERLAMALTQEVEEASHRPSKPMIKARLEDVPMSDPAKWSILEPDSPPVLT